MRYATYLLKDDASLWWEGAKEGVNLDTLTWAQFKDIFYEKYFTADVRGRLNREFTSLRQGDMTVVEYIRRFYRGCHFVPLNANDAAEVEAFHCWPPTYYPSGCDADGSEKLCSRYD